MISLKKIMAITLVFVVLLSSTISVNAVDSFDTTQGQRDILMALGVEESKIESLTPEEIGQILAHGKLVNPEYIRKYLPTSEQLQADYDNYQKQLNQIILKFPGLSKEDVERMLRFSRISPDNFMSLSPSQVEKLKQQSLISLQVAFDSTKYTNFTQGPDKLKYYAYSSCDIHRNTLRTSYARYATAAHYSEMNDNVAYARAIGNALFNTTININNVWQYSYGLWGDWYPSVGGAHQGIDYTIIDGAPVYTVARGEVVSIKQEYGGTTLVIENKALKLRYIYMHLKNVTRKKGDYVYEGQKIGEQGWYYDNTHVHFEVADDLTRTTGHPNQTNNVYSVNPYFAGLYYIAD